MYFFLSAGCAHHSLRAQLEATSANTRTNTNAHSVKQTNLSPCRFQNGDTMMIASKGEADGRQWHRGGGRHHVWRGTLSSRGYRSFLLRFWQGLCPLTQFYTICKLLCISFFFVHSAKLYGFDTGALSTENSEAYFSRLTKYALALHTPCTMAKHSSFLHVTVIYYFILFTLIIIIIPNVWIYGSSAHSCIANANTHNNAIKENF